MVLCQAQFNKFHEAIKLKKENEELRSKRDIIVKKIKDNLSKDKHKSFEVFNQGSYAMSTGIKPLDDDYDIDVGLYFEMSSEEVKPVEAKKWVFNAIYDQTSVVDFKNPCVTITYAAGYHVDVTVYAADNLDGKVYLAKGKPTSKSVDKFWDESNPKDLIEEIRNHLDDEKDRKQFRRIVRYLKRWKDEKFTKGNGKPTGIALTSCVYHWLEIQKEIDLFTGKESYKDLDALIYVVNQMITRFVNKLVEVDGEYKSMPRLEVYLPVAPYPELFEKMTYPQMRTFKERLETLLEALEDAKAKEDPTDAAKILQKQFGSAFPVPPRPTTGKKSVTKSVVPSADSAYEG